MNATAAVASSAWNWRFPRDTIREALDSFSGVDRRFQIKGVEHGITVIDDYGHHPTEIRATLAAARACRYPKVHVLFQPHRYSQDRRLDGRLRSAPSIRPTAFTCWTIYAASEAPIRKGVTAEALVDRITAFGHRKANYAPSMDAGIDAVAKAASPGEAIVTLGAGSVYQAGDRILEELKGRRP